MGAPSKSRLISTPEDMPDLALAFLNEATQAWVDHQYNPKINSELGEAAITRFFAGPKGTRACPDRDALRLAFTQSDRHTQRKNDGTIVIEGGRFVWLERHHINHVRGAPQTPDDQARSSPSTRR